MRHTRITIAALAAHAVSAANPVAAAICSERPVIARGDPSFYEVLAKAKARGNWRAKVRSMPTLGGAYANWKKALTPTYRCSEKAGTVVCVASARPCRD
jgi:hypothetical protein